MKIKEKLMEYFRAYWGKRVFMKSVSMLVAVCFVINIANLPAYAAKRENSLLNKKAEIKNKQENISNQNIARPVNEQVEINDIKVQLDEEALRDFDKKEMAITELGAIVEKSRDGKTEKIVGAVDGNRNVQIFSEDSSRPYSKKMTEDYAYRAQQVLNSKAKAGQYVDTYSKEYTQIIVEKEKETEQTKGITEAVNNGVLAEHGAVTKITAEIGKSAKREGLVVTFGNKEEKKEGVQKDKKEDGLKNTKEYKSVVKSLMKDTGASKEEVEASLEGITEDQLKVLNDFYKQEGATIVNCATDALGNILEGTGLTKGLLALQALSIDIAKGNLSEDSVKDGQLHTSMTAINEVLKANGIESVAYGTDLETLKDGLKEGESAIVWVDENHYITVTKEKDGNFSVQDPNKNNGEKITFDEENFDKLMNGEEATDSEGNKQSGYNVDVNDMKVVTASEGMKEKAAEGKVRELSEAETNEITGAKYVTKTVTVAVEKTRTVTRTATRQVTSSYTDSEGVTHTETHTEEYTYEEQESYIDYEEREEQVWVDDEPEEDASAQEQAAIEERNRAEREAEEARRAAELARLEAEVARKNLENAAQAAREAEAAVDRGEIETRVVSEERAEEVETANAQRVEEMERAVVEKTIEAQAATQEALTKSEEAAAIAEENFANGIGKKEGLEGIAAGVMGMSDVIMSKQFAQKERENLEQVTQNFINLQKSNEDSNGIVVAGNNTGFAVNDKTFEVLDGKNADSIIQATSSFVAELKDKNFLPYEYASYEGESFNQLYDNVLAGIMNLMEGNEEEVIAILNNINENGLVRSSEENYIGTGEAIWAGIFALLCKNNNIDVDTADDIIASVDEYLESIKIEETGSVRFKQSSQQDDKSVSCEHMLDAAYYYALKCDGENSDKEDLETLNGILKYLYEDLTVTYEGDEGNTRFIFIVGKNPDGTNNNNKAVDTMTWGYMMLSAIGAMGIPGIDATFKDKNDNGKEVDILSEEFLNDLITALDDAQREDGTFSFFSYDDKKQQNAEAVSGEFTMQAFATYIASGDTEKAEEILAAAQEQGLIVSNLSDNDENIGVRYTTSEFGKTPRPQSGNQDNNLSSQRAMSSTFWLYAAVQELKYSQEDGQGNIFSILASKKASSEKNIFEKVLSGIQDFFENLTGAKEETGSNGYKEAKNAVSIFSFGVFSDNELGKNLTKLISKKFGSSVEIQDSGKINSIYQENENKESAVLKSFDKIKSIKQLEIFSENAPVGLYLFEDYEEICDFIKDSDVRSKDFTEDDIINSLEFLIVSDTLFNAYDIDLSETEFVRFGFDGEKDTVTFIVDVKGTEYAIDAVKDKGIVAIRNNADGSSIWEAKGSKEIIVREESNSSRQGNSVTLETKRSDWENEKSVYSDIYELSNEELQILAGDFDKEITERFLAFLILKRQGEDVEVSDEMLDAAKEYLRDIENGNIKIITDEEESERQYNSATDRLKASLAMVYYIMLESYIDEFNVEESVLNEIWNDIYDNAKVVTMYSGMANSNFVFQPNALAPNVMAHELLHNITDVYLGKERTLTTSSVAEFSSDLALIAFCEEIGVDIPQRWLNDYKEDASYIKTGALPIEEHYLARGIIGLIMEMSVEVGTSIDWDNMMSAVAQNLQESSFIGLLQNDQFMSAYSMIMETYFEIELGGRPLISYGNLTEETTSNLYNMIEYYFNKYAAKAFKSKQVSQNRMEYQAAYTVKENIIRTAENILNIRQNTGTMSEKLNLDEADKPNF